MAVIDDFRLKYTVFNGISDPVVEDALCEADAETGGKGWGSYVNECTNFKQRGMFLYAAHYLASTYPNSDESVMSGASVSAVQSKSVGDESVTFAVPVASNQGDAWLSSTAFGQQFIRLRRRAGMGARAV